MDDSSSYASVRRSRGVVANGADGQSIPIVALVLWSMAATAILIAALGDRAVVRARVQAGADAVALAAAGGGSVDEVATTNGVRVEGLEGSVEVDVVVASGSVQAAARSRVARPELVGLTPTMLRAIGRTELALGEKLVIVSGYRSHADQLRLWLGREQNPYPVAPPGTSLHEAGLAIDVAIHQVDALAGLAGRTGLCQPLPETDPVHFVVC